jgi:paraquat-inducible protein A
MATAASKGLASCNICGKLSNDSLEHCPRCNSTLYLRKPSSIQRVLAYLITACLLYIPANVLPITITITITITNQLGRELNSTIIGGVIFLWGTVLILWPSSYL